MKLPRGRLVRRRVVTDAGTVLAAALESALTGYARLESQDSLLLDADGTGVLTFEGGIPIVAYHTGTERGGREALDDIAVAGPYRVELFELETDALERINGAESLRVPPGMPADRLAADPTLSDKTRDKASDERTYDSETQDEGSPESAVEAFLSDGERIEEIRERARAEAERRAAEWDL